MGGRFAGLVFAALLIAAPALAQETPAPVDPETALSNRIDGYFFSPGSVETFRALEGMGDAEFDRPHEIERPADEVAALNRMYPELGGDQWRWGGPYGGGWDWRATCRFDYAGRTLARRMATLGANHPYVQRWIDVQRAVFETCRDREAPITQVRLPPALATSDPNVARLQTADRAYQAASLAFYQGRMPAALSGFGSLAQGSSSHRATAAYMVAAIRAGSNVSDWQPHPLVTPAQSIRDIRAIIANPALAEVHNDAQDLLGWVIANNLNPATGQTRVRSWLDALEAPTATLASSPQAQHRYIQAQQDIDWLVAEFDDPAWWLGQGPSPEERPSSRAMMEAARTDRLAAWLLFPHGLGRPDTEYGNPSWAALNLLRNPRYAPGWHSFDKLRDFASDHSDSGRARAWRIASDGVSYPYLNDCASLAGAVQIARAGDEAVIAAFGFNFYDAVRDNLSVGQNNPQERRQGFANALTCMRAYPFKHSGVYGAAARDALRLLMATGRIPEARTWRDAFPEPMQYEGGILALLAEDQDHFVAAIIKRDPNQTATSPISSNPILLNVVSIDTLFAIAARTDVPADMRALVSRVAWTRSYALGRTIQRRNDALMRQLNPEITASWRSRPRDVRPNDRVVLLDALRSPGLNILINEISRRVDPSGPEDPFTRIDTFQHSDNNWWCRFQTERQTKSFNDYLLITFFRGEAFKLLDSEDAFRAREGLQPMLAASYAIRAQDAGELEALADIDCAPKVLSARAIDWANHPGFGGRRDIPEALALAVRTTRWGCQRDGGHGAYSRAAYRTLHRLYPNSDAARRTRYWFDCAHFSGGCPPAQPAP